MKINHPFEWIKETSQSRVFFFWLIVTVVVIVGMQLLGNPLITKAAPAGIVSFEFAGDVEKAQEIMASWRHELRVFAGLNLGLDYVFMIAYGGTIGLGCVLVAQQWKEEQTKLSLMGYLIAWGSIAAAVLDAIENYALIRILVGSLNEMWPIIAKWCAGLKFTLVGLGLLYILGGALFQFMQLHKK